MAIRVPYTNTINRRLIIPRFIVKIIFIIAILWGFAILLDYVEIFQGVSEIVSSIIFILILVGGLVLSNYIFNLTAGKFFSTLSAFLYIRRKLDTNISWKDARFVSFLFVPTDTGKWYTMQEVLNLPSNQRATYIVEFAKKILSNYLYKN